jgi:hypothetical protein
MCCCATGAPHLEASDGAGTTPHHQVLVLQAAGGGHHLGTR